MSISSRKMEMLMIVLCILVSTSCDNKTTEDDKIDHTNYPVSYVEDFLVGEIQYRKFVEKRSFLTYEEYISNRTGSTIEHIYSLYNKLDSSTLLVNVNGTPETIYETNHPCEYTVTILADEVFCIKVEKSIAPNPILLNRSISYEEVLDHGQPGKGLADVATTDVSVPFDPPTMPVSPAKGEDAFEIPFRTLSGSEDFERILYFVNNSSVISVKPGTALVLSDSGDFLALATIHNMANPEKGIIRNTDSTTQSKDIELGASFNLSNINVDPLAMKIEPPYIAYIIINTITGHEIYNGRITKLNKSIPPNINSCKIYISKLGDKFKAKIVTEDYGIVYSD